MLSVLFASKAVADRSHLPAQAGRPFLSASNMFVQRARSLVARNGGRTMSMSAAAVTAAMTAAASSVGIPAHAEGVRVEHEHGDLLTDKQLRRAVEDGYHQHRPNNLLSTKELHEGNGDIAETGMWVTVHYSVRLLGDDSLIEETRTSGYGERDFGEPLTFELGDLGDDAVLRVLHAAVLDMRVGGCRRVRTGLTDEAFGYRTMPPVYLRDANGTRYLRQYQGDWLMDVQVELLAVSRRPPQSRYAALAERLLPEAAWAVVSKVIR